MIQIVQFFRYGDRGYKNYQENLVSKAKSAEKLRHIEADFLQSIFKHLIA
jgi:hypothetical protein